MTKQSDQEFQIGTRVIGNGHRPFVIAEMSANHKGDLSRAIALLEAAKAAGADAVKMQTYTPDTMTIDCDLPDFVIEGGLWDGYGLYQLYEEAQTPWEWHPVLFEHARKLEITLFSSPFDETAIELLESLSAPAYKIASFEATDLPLVACAAATGKPLIVSTGLADEDEIGETIETARSAGCRNLLVLHCLSAYPAPVEQYNLRAIQRIAQRFDVLSGLSDHTLGNTAAVAAVALGACAIEKHFTIARSDGGPDAEFSLEPDELRCMCAEVRACWDALGSGNIGVAEAESGNRKFRRSVVVVEDIKAGETFTKRNIRRIRPGYGLAPKHYEAILGKKASSDLSRGTPLDWKWIAD